VNGCCTPYTFLILARRQLLRAFSLPLRPALRLLLLVENSILYRAELKKIKERLEVFRFMLTLMVEVPTLPTAMESFMGFTLRHVLVRHWQRYWLSK